jgi:hypothetical protein
MIFRYLGYDLLILIFSLDLIRFFNHLVISSAPWRVDLSQYEEGRANSDDNLFKGSIGTIISHSIRDMPRLVAMFVEHFEETDH